MRCRDLQALANAPYLKGFLCCALPRVAPYCAPGGVRVSIQVHICFTMRLARGTHPKYVQHLARHASIQLILDHYSH
jgi:hypothetical protein